MSQTHSPRRRHILPGFSLTLGYTLFYLGLMVILPFGALLLKGTSMTGAEFWHNISSERAIASYQLTLLSALGAAAVNAVFGVWIAWILVRYEFPGKKIIDALVDLPFALPAAVGGIALTAIYAPTGWIGQWLYPLGIETAYSPIGVTIAMLFVGLPFVVRSVQPVLAELEADVEEAAYTLGATAGQRFRLVIFPLLLPAMLTGFALALARGIGEYGAVIFISGNLPLKTEVASLAIVIKLDQYDYAGATAIAIVMLAAAFLLLLTINLLQAWTRFYERKVS